MKHSVVSLVILTHNVKTNKHRRPGQWYQRLLKSTLLLGVQTLTMGSERPVAVLRWGQGGTGPPNLAQAPKFLDTVVLLLVELIGSIVNFA